SIRSPARDNNHRKCPVSWVLTFEGEYSARRSLKALLTSAGLQRCPDFQARPAWPGPGGRVLSLSPLGSYGYGDASQSEGTMKSAGGKPPFVWAPLGCLAIAVLLGMASDRSQPQEIRADPDTRPKDDEPRKPGAPGADELPALAKARLEAAHK